LVQRETFAHWDRRAQAYSLYCADKGATPLLKAFQKIES